MKLFYTSPKDMVNAIYNKVSPELISQQTAGRRIGDAWGSGRFGAPRGKRIHKGIDFLVPAGSVIYSPVSGRITKHGLCYRGDEYNYVQVTDLQGNYVRLFYVEPALPVGEEINRGDPVGYMEELGIRYHPVRDGEGAIVKDRMPNHCHVEILSGDTPERLPINPDSYQFS